MGRPQSTQTDADLIDELTAEFATYRDRPLPGGWDTFKARLDRAARRHRMSASDLFGQVHRRYEEQAAG